MLALADLEYKSEQGIKNHLATEYCGERNDDEGSPTPDDIREVLKAYDILIAYESLDGYDAVSWFLLKETGMGEFFMITGAHNSCVGFEGQFELEHTCAEYLTDSRFYFETSSNSDDDVRQVNKYIKDMFSDTPEYFNKDPVLDLRSMKNKSESAIKDHIAEHYCEVDWNESGSGFDCNELRAFLEEYDILVAYENDMHNLWFISSWFLLRDQKNGDLYILSGNDCNRGDDKKNQFNVEKTSAKELVNLQIKLEMKEHHIEEYQVNMKIENYLKNMFSVDDPLPNGP